MTYRSGDPGDAASALIDRVVTQTECIRRPSVAISGHAGSGKSTLARLLENRIAGCVRVRVDNFLDPRAVHRRSGEWTGVQRDRLITEVLTPFAAGRPVFIRPLDWSSGSLGKPERIPPARVLCLDGIGLFHPDLIGRFDMRIWIDIDPETAMTRGRARDRSAGLDHDDLWSHVWFANDADFDERFAPRNHADVVFDNNMFIASR